MTIWHRARTCSLNCAVPHSLFYSRWVILQKLDHMDNPCGVRAESLILKSSSFSLRFRKMLVHLMRISASLEWFIVQFNLIFWCWRLFSYLRSAGKFLSPPPPMESLTPPSPKYTIFGRHYNSSPLAQTHSYHRHTPLPPPLTYFTAQLWTQCAHAPCLWISRSVSRSVGHMHTSTALPPCSRLRSYGKMVMHGPNIYASKFSGCSVPHSAVSLTTMDKVRTNVEMHSNIHSCDWR